MSTPPNVGIVYVCPSCGRFFDSPSMCEDGTATEPKLMTVTREQVERLAHVPGFTTFASGARVVSCSCGWSSWRIRDHFTEEHLWNIYRQHVNAEDAR